MVDFTELNLMIVIYIFIYVGHRFVDFTVIWLYFNIWTSPSYRINRNKDLTDLKTSPSYDITVVSFYTLSTIFNVEKFESRQHQTVDLNR